MTRASLRLRFVVMLGVLALGAGAWPIAQVVQQPPGPPGAPGTQPASGTGFISGQVVDLPSGRPIPEATVNMLGRGQMPPGQPVGRGSAQQQSLVTDSQGRFYFARLPNGTYTISATKPGYAAARTVTSVELTDAERVTDIKIRLALLATITGTVRDTAGDPVVGTTMLAFRRSSVEGRQGWQQFGRAVTDDRGSYRISNLLAGDYVVCACSRDPIPFDGQLLTTIASEPISLLGVAARALSVGADAVSLDNTLKTFAPRFHPESPTVARATRITLAPGDEKTSIDVSLDMVRATRVSGRVTGAQGPVQASSIRLTPMGDAESNLEFTFMQPMLVQADGRFDFAPVPPGQYQLMVAHRETGATGGGPSGLALGFAGARGVQPPAAPVRMGGPGPAGEVLWANEQVTVGDNGVSGLVVGLNHGMSVRGRLQYVGAAPQPPAQQFQRINVVMSPLNFNRVPAAYPGPIAQDATFGLQGVIPGKYTINVPALPGYPSLKSVTLGGADITDLPIEVKERDLTELVVTFVDTPLATLTVTTEMPPAEQSPDEIVFLVFPADRKYWQETSAARRRFRSGGMPVKGVVNLADVPAGDYFVLLGNATDLMDWADAARLDLLSRRAQRVTVAESGKQTIAVRR